jgi:hypothetical protein
MHFHSIRGRVSWMASGSKLAGSIGVPKDLKIGRGAICHTHSFRTDRNQSIYRS